MVRAGLKGGWLNNRQCHKELESFSLLHHGQDLLHPKACYPHWWRGLWSPTIPSSNRTSFIWSERRGRLTPCGSTIVNQLISPCICLHLDPCCLQLAHPEPFIGKEREIFRIDLINHLKGSRICPLPSSKLYIVRLSYHFLNGWMREQANLWLQVEILVISRKEIVNCHRNQLSLFDFRAHNASMPLVVQKGVVRVNSLTHTFALDKFCSDTDSLRSINTLLKDRWHEHAEEKQDPKHIIYSWFPKRWFRWCTSTALNNFELLRT